MNITAPEIEFLRESNNIESEYDDKSLEDAILAWMWIKNKKKLSVELILDIHQILMDSRETIGQKYKGAYRDIDVWIGGHPGKPVYAVPELMKNWIEAVNMHAKHPPLEIPEKVFLCKEDHVNYEATHPFVDGNGRTGRIFYNWERLQMGLSLDIIHTGEEQFSYYEWFK